MTPSEAAEAAAAAEHLTVFTYSRALYVRAFLAGAQWQQTQEFRVEYLEARVETLKRKILIRDGELPSNAPDSRTAATDREEP